MCVCISDLRQLLISHMGFLCILELSVNTILMGKDGVGTLVLSILQALFVPPDVAAVDIKMIIEYPLFIICNRKLETF